LTHKPNSLVFLLLWVECFKMKIHDLLNHNNKKKTLLKLLILELTYTRSNDLINIQATLDGVICLQPHISENFLQVACSLSNSCRKLWGIRCTMYISLKYHGSPCIFLNLDLSHCWLINWSFMLYSNTIK
jgi:hypothetical protein